MCDKHQITEEPCEGKLSSTVLESSGSRKGVADFNPKCGHTEKGNRDGEKFVCRACGHAEHADTGASRKIAKKGGLSFPPHQKRLPADCGEVTPVKISTPLWVESRNLNLSELSSEKKGYRRDIKETSGESPRL